MAQHNKATDPVSQAMLAIEDALSLGMDETEIAEHAASDDEPSTDAAPATAEAQPIPPPEHRLPARPPLRPRRSPPNRRR